MILICNTGSVPLEIIIAGAMWMYSGITSEGLIGVGRSDKITVQFNSAEQAWY
jgi:hypothetical protein